MEIPYAPLILASVSDNNPGGGVVLKLETRLTRQQVLEVDEIQKVCNLMRETMEEIWLTRI